MKLCCFDSKRKQKKKAIISSIIIPGLPNDIARQCLLRIHCLQISTISSVSKAWKSELQPSEFWRHRKQLCNGKQPIVLKYWNGNIFKLLVYEPETSIWSDLPSIPEFPNGLRKTFPFGIASFKWGFVIMGAFLEDCCGKRPFCNKVFVFDYLSATWQRGANMPKGQLCVDRCTSDGDRMVYVLSKKRCYTECIMLYDVTKDEWSTSRIDTEEHGGDCVAGSMRRMMYQGGKIHFVDDWVQGGHTNDLRTFNVSTWKWDPPEVGFFHCCARGFCLSEEGEWYSWFSRPGSESLQTYKDSEWQEIVQVPWKEEDEFEFMTTWKSKLMVIWGRWKEDEQGLIEDRFKSRMLEARVFDLKNHKWTALDTPKEFRGTFSEYIYN